MKLLKKVRRAARCKWNNSVRSLTTTLRWDGEEVTGISYSSKDKEYFKGIMWSKKDEITRVFTHQFWKLEKANYMKKYAKYLKARGEG